MPGTVESSFIFLIFGYNPPIGGVFMARTPRILFDGTVYHIYQRGNNKDFIFRNPKHKTFLLKQLREYNKRFDYQLLAYAIMDNHYHFAIRTNKDPIDRIMFNVNNVMSKFLNRELNRTGHIYESRYGCEVVDNDAYLIWLLRYIHRNPVRAGICEKVKDYRWSSNIFYQYNYTSSFIDINYILNIISSNRFQAINQYLNLMDTSGCDNNREKDFSFVKDNYNLKETPSCVNSNNVITLQRFTLNDIMQSINVSDDAKQLILKGDNHKSLIPYKIEFLKAALASKYSLVEISRFINTTPGALRKFRDYHKIIT